jgi:hypothetical protein
MRGNGLGPVRPVSVRFRLAPGSGLPARLMSILNSPRRDSGGLGYLGAGRFRALM